MSDQDDTRSAHVGALLNEHEQRNPTLVSLVRRYAELSNRANEINQRAQADGRRDLSDEETTEVTNAVAQLRTLVPSIDTLRDEVARQRTVAEAAAEHDAGLRGELGGGQVPRLLPTPAQVDEMHRSLDEQTARRWTVGDERVTGGGQSLAADSHRASVTTTLTGIGTQAMRGTSLREPRRIATAAGLPVERVAGVSPVAFPVFAAGTATAVAEGLTKAEYSAITAGSATPQMISVWTDSTRQALLSMPGYEQRLLAKHAALLAKAEDALLVARILAAPTQTMTAGSASLPYSETLLRAAALALSSDVATAPNLALINPADIAKFFPAATTTGAGGESPTSDLKLGLHGMTVYPTTAVAAGTAIVGAFAAGSHLVLGLSPTVLVDSVSQLKKNLVTHLSEEAVTLAVDEPLAFVSITNLAA